MSPDALQAADRRATTREWLAVAAVALGTFTLVTSEFIPVGLLTRMAPDLHASEGAVGLMMTIPALVAAVSAPAAMLGARQLDRRVILWLLSALLVVSNLVVAYAPTLPVALFGRVLLGIDVGAFWAISSIVAGKLVPSASLSRANSIIFAGISLGTVVGVPAGAFIGSALGWRAAFETVAIFGAVVLMAQIVYLPRIPPSEVVSVKHLAAIFRIPKARLGLIVCFFIFLAQFAGYTYMGAFLEQVTLASPSLLSSLLLGYGLAGFIGNFVGGSLAPRNPLMALMGTSLLMGVSIVLLTLMGHSQAPASLMVLAWGFAFGALPIATQAWMLKVAPGEMESASAVYISILQLGFASGAFFGGRVVDTLGVNMTLAGAGVIAVLAAVVVLQFGRERGVSARAATTAAACQQAD
jgi:predicted MFS family arabinose efflux permease